MKKKESAKMLASFSNFLTAQFSGKARRLREELMEMLAATGQLVRQAAVCEGDIRLLIRAAKCVFASFNQQNFCARKNSKFIIAKYYQ